jgi:hypothetical protein
MGRLAISAGVAAALVAAAVALGAASDVRIHRLHLPPPPAGDEAGGTAPPAGGTTDPSPPGIAPPAPPSAPPQPPAPPPSSVGCSTAGDIAGADVTGTLSDYSIALSAASIAAAPTLRFRGIYPAGGDLHNLTLRNPDGTVVCGTTNLSVASAGTFTITNLPPGAYQLVCTIHVGAPFGMHVPFTVS